MSITPGTSSARHKGEVAQVRAGGSRRPREHVSTAGDGGRRAGLASPGFGTSLIVRASACDLASRSRAAGRRGEEGRCGVRCVEGLGRHVAPCPRRARRAPIVCARRRRAMRSSESRTLASSVGADRARTGPGEREQDTERVKRGAAEPAFVRSRRVDARPGPTTSGKQRSGAARPASASPGRCGRRPTACIRSSHASPSASSSFTAAVRRSSVSSAGSSMSGRCSRCVYARLITSACMPT